MDRRNIVKYFREGFLNKLGKKTLQGYKKRWFVLTGTVLKYYSTQDTSENNCLGVVDMGKVVSVTKNKLTKYGFQISTNARTYFLAAKISEEERDNWISVLENSAAEAKRQSMLSCASSISSGKVNEELNHEYSLVGGRAPINPSRCSTGYDLISYGISEDNTMNGNLANETENLYETLGEANGAPSTQKLPLKDVDNDSNVKESYHHPFKMSSIMSKLSMESLDSIDSLDSLEDDLNTGTTDCAATSCHLEPDGTILPKPHGKIYATEEMKELLQSRKHSSDSMKLEKIASDYNLQLDKNTDYPAFDALRKFLNAIK